MLKEPTYFLIHDLLQHSVRSRCAKMEMYIIKALMLECIAPEQAEILLIEDKKLNGGERG